MNDINRTIVFKLILMTVKVKEIRNIRVSSYNKLLQTVKEYSKIEDLSTLNLRYLDEEGDWITFDSKIGFEEIHNIKTSPIRLRVQHPQRHYFQRFRRGMMRNYRCQERRKRCQQLSRFRCHKNIICDCCGKKEWKGLRFKCQDCPTDLNLCGRCFRENRMIHDVDHKFRKVAMTWKYSFQKKQHQKKVEMKKELPSISLQENDQDQDQEEEEEDDNVLRPFVDRSC